MILFENLALNYVISIPSSLLSNYDRSQIIRNPDNLESAAFMNERYKSTFRVGRAKGGGGVF